MGQIKLKTGRVIRATRGIVGIRDDLDISEGYDGGLLTPDDAEWIESAPTRADMIELADIMLDRWRRFRAKWAGSVLI